MIFFVLALFFSCKTGNESGGGKDAKLAENEALLNFRVEGDGGELKAEVDGAFIASPSSIIKGKVVHFTAIPKDSSWEVADWSGDMLNVSHDRKTASLKIEMSQTVTVSFRKMEVSLPEDFVKVPVMNEPIRGLDVDYPLSENTPRWKGVFTYERKVLLSPYAIAKHEVSYGLWYEVREWAEQHGYKFKNKGLEGFLGMEGEAPKEADLPVTKISWFDSIIWCNAYTEKVRGADAMCVYLKDDVPLKDSTNIEECKEAKAHIARSGFRLPTEAEWEWAARYQGEEACNADKYGNIYLTRLDSASGAKKSCGFEGYLLKSGETWESLRDEVARVAIYAQWFNGKKYVDQNPKTSSCVKVNANEPNTLGLYNMSGNVSEWCFDFYDEDASVADAAYIGDGGAVLNPQGALKGKEKVTRGSNYFADADYMSVALRDTFPPEAAKKGICGMRVVCSVK